MNMGINVEGDSLLVHRSNFLIGEIEIGKLFYVVNGGIKMISRWGYQDDL